MAKSFTSKDKQKENKRDLHKEAHKLRKLRKNRRNKWASND